MITHSWEETEKFGFDFAEKFEYPGIIILDGQLGAGKTVFVRGFSRGLGITQEITSPTFLIVNSYPFRKKDDHLFFHHFDLYRITGFDELYYIGIEEYLEQKNAITIFEWGVPYINDFKQYKFRSAYLVSLEILDEETRNISVKSLYDPV